MTAAPPAHPAEARTALLDRMIGFVRAIGIEVAVVALPQPTFLPGLQIVGGGLQVDPSRLRHPGDILHEAGHIAVCDPVHRPALHQVPADGGDEMAAIAWSYAAALRLGLDPAIVFHAGGYKGGAAALLDNFAQGRFVGVPLLQWFDMTAGPAAPRGWPAYPQMAHWLRGGAGARTPPAAETP